MVSKVENVKNSQILDSFGKLLVERVRDRSIFIHEKILSGEMGSKESISLYESAKKDPNKKLISDCIISAIDETIHHFLWMIEQYEEFDLVYRDGDKITSLRDISDGLCGEPLTEEGWIARFSKYPPSME